MHYVIGDVHNEAGKLKRMLAQIALAPEDEVILLGDIFDRGVEPEPMETYFTVLGLGAQCTWIKGNHDQWLGEYIRRWLTCSEKERQRMWAYPYNTFELLQGRMTEVDLLHLADHIQSLPLQKTLCLDGKKYLFAHAQTSHPLKRAKKAELYLMGGCGFWSFEHFLKNGVDGYISLCGHKVNRNLSYMYEGRYLEESVPSIWVNELRNVYLLDCGSGFGGGNLGCLCLETGERYYV